MADEYAKRSLALHREHGGKLAVRSKVPIESKEDLSLAYTPGVAEPCRIIAAHPEEAFTLTLKKNSVAVVSDGSAVLGLGNIGPLAAIPVMEGKAVLFKEYADIDAFPICCDTQDVDEIVRFVTQLAPVFGGINLEDFSAPRCFEIEARLQDLGIPVMHDDQHGTAIVVLAALINAARVTNRRIDDLRVVINGAGAAGTAVAKLLRCVGLSSTECTSVKEILICDSKGILSTKRNDIAEHPVKQELAKLSRTEREGSLADALTDADLFIGVSKGNLLTEPMLRSMAKDPIIFALANPVPEVMPDDAKRWGAAVVGTGRSDFANQINNVLAFPGVFRGALDARAPRITDRMKIAAAWALADHVVQPSPERIIPSPLDKHAAQAVAEAVFAEASSRSPGAHRGHE